jgi:hypothetical protein
MLRIRQTVLIPMKIIAFNWMAAFMLTIASAKTACAQNSDGVAAPRAPAASLSDVLTAEARQMIATYPNTRYSHKTHIDKAQGVCEVDCSGFIVSILRHKAPKLLAAINTTRKRPLADDFYAAFVPRSGAPAGGWQPIARLADAQPGDLLAWVKADRVPGDNTGHVMLIAERPIPESAGRFRVRIFDSTLHGHAQDVRTNTGRSGIGQGTLWFDVDGQGRPVAYRWKSPVGQPHTAPIAIGRPVSIE